jgi:hypothetical protein
LIIVCGAKTVVAVHAAAVFAFYISGFADPPQRLPKPKLACRFAKQQGVYGITWLVEERQREARKKKDLSLAIYGMIRISL